MADASRPPPAPSPADWGAAFAALPQETPPASRWPALAARLETRARRRRFGRTLALAAGLGALAALPLWLLSPAREDRPAPVASVPNSGSPEPAAPALAAATAPAPVTADATPAASAAAVPPHSHADADARIAAASAAAAPRERNRSTAPPIGVRLSTSRDTAPSVTNAARDAPVVHPRKPWPKPALSADDPESLDSLFAASAKLESLLVAARDPRVASGPAAALGGAYEAELATIDARLAQPGLGDDEQRALWRARVDALQRAAGLETQLRVLAADGRQLDGALVGID